MTYDYYRHVCCPLCGRGEMLMVNAFLVRCTECEETISYSLFKTLHEIRNLREARGKHPCECGHPEMRRLPDGTYRCPSCNPEISYPRQGNKESSDLPGIPFPPKRESRNSRHKAGDQMGANENPFFRDERQPG